MTYPDDLIEMGDEFARERQAVLEILEDHGDLTAVELAKIMHIRGIIPAPKTRLASAYLSDLRDAGKVETAGRAAEKQGRDALLWRKKEESHDIRGYAKKVGGAGEEDSGTGRG